MDHGVTHGRRRPRAGRRAAAALSAAVLAVSAAGAVQHGLDPSPAGGSAPSAGVPPMVAAPAPTGARPDAAAAPSLLAQVATLLAARAAAVRKHDQVAFLATSDRTARAAARTAFDRVAALPWSRWQYRVTSVVPRARAGAAAGDLPVAADVVASVETRLGGFDSASTTVSERLVLVRGAQGWRVAREAASGPRPALWQVGAVRAVRGSRTLVVGVGNVPRSTLAWYADAGDAAGADVSRLWGSGWRRPAVVVVPATTADLARLIGRPGGDLVQIAAVSTDESGDPVAGADRVWVNRPVMRGLTATGRSVVLRHELVHVAAGATSTSSTPLWLEEGLAEYFGYLGSGLPVAAVAADVVASLDEGWRPGTLPADADFGPTDPHLARTYEAAWLACRLVAARWGAARLLAVYREASAGWSSDPEKNADAALVRVIGIRRAALELQWRGYVRAVAGSAGSSPA